MAETISETPIGAYDLLAAEYYDSRQHPTCANFREASRNLLDRLTPDVPASRCCEVGAGDSLLAEVIARRDQDLRGLSLTDAHWAMLEYSRRWEQFGAVLSIAEAARLPLPDASLGLLVASLGDPYNNDGFWSEVARVLEPDGLCLFTTPAWAWASSFRADGQLLVRAEFQLRDLRIIEVPSYVRPPSEEIQLIESHDLRVVHIEHIERAMVHEPVSHKLRMLTPDEPVVTGFAVAKA